MKKNLFKTLFLIFIILPFKISAIEINAKTVILQDYLSGKILYEKDADLRIYPASMTKIMTSVIAFDLLNTGDLSLDEKFLISENAWRMSKSGYSSMFIMLNDEVSVEDLLKGIIIVSGNDACIALAEGIAGSEEEFAIMMNAKAAEIGMTNTNFTNSSGIDHINNYSTVRDILIVSDYLIRNYPGYYSYFKELEFTWYRTGGDPITQGNRNPLLYKNIGADGIKTGFLGVEKYSLASSIYKNNRRLIAVASGFATKKKRSTESSKLHIWGLTNFDTIEIAKKNDKFASLDVWLGSKNSVDAYINEDVYITIPKGKKRLLKAELNYQGPIHAPIKKNTIIGELKIFLQDNLIATYEVLSKEDVKRVNIISRIIKSFNYLLWGDV